MEQKFTQTIFGGDLQGGTQNPQGGGGGGVPAPAKKNLV